MHFALCKEQQHIQKGIFCDYGVAEATPGFQAGWSDCMYFFTLSVHFVCSSGFSVLVFVLMRMHCLSKLSLDALSG
jgi:hypothetical protein